MYTHTHIFRASVELGTGFSVSPTCLTLRTVLRLYSSDESLTALSQAADPLPHTLSKSNCQYLEREKKGFKDALTMLNDLDVFNEEQLTWWAAQTPYCPPEMQVETFRLIDRTLLCEY